MNSNNLTEQLCRSLAALPAAGATARGARLAAAVWSAFPAGTPAANGASGAAGTAAASGALTASSRAGRGQAAEAAAFQNTLAFALQTAAGGQSSSPADAERLAWSIPVLAATALAEARGLDLSRLHHALGVGFEAYVRIARCIEGTATQARFDWQILAASFAAIVACGTLERLDAAKLTLAVGLGGSSLTASDGGYVPAQAAMAAQEAITMVLLIVSGFRAPPDVLGCRWGVFDVFSGTRRASGARLEEPADDDEPAVRRLTGASAGSRSLPTEGSVRDAAQVLFAA